MEKVIDSNCPVSVGLEPKPLKGRKDRPFAGVSRSNIKRMNKLADILIKKSNGVVKTNNNGDVIPNVNINVVSKRLNMSQELVKAGYAKTSATRKSREILSSKSFKQILAEKITNEEVLTIQKSNLEAKTMHTVKVPNTFTEQDAKTLANKLNGEFAMFSPHSKFGKQAFFIIPYYKIRDISLDKLYKLAGSYSAEKIEVNTRPLETMTDEELELKMLEASKRFKKD